MKRKVQPDQVVTAREIAAHFGITSRTLTDWFAAGLPHKRDKHGQNVRVRLWDLAEWIYKRDGVPESPGASDSPALERSRLADAIRKERLNALEEKTLLKADEVRRQVRAIAHTLRAQMDTLVRTRPEMEAELRATFETAAEKIEKDFTVDGAKEAVA